MPWFPNTYKRTYIRINDKLISTCKLCICLVLIDCLACSFSFPPSTFLVISINHYKSPSQIGNPRCKTCFFPEKEEKKHAAILKSRNYKISRLSSLSDICKLPLWAFPAIKAGMRGVVSPFVILRAPLVAAPLHFISCSLGVFHVLKVPVFQYLVPRVLVGCLCMFSTMSTLYVLQ